MRHLFWHGKAYDLPKSERLFHKKIIENMLFQYDNCVVYRELLERKGYGMSHAPIGMAHDGEYPLRRYTKIVEVE